MKNHTELVAEFHAARGEDIEVGAFLPEDNVRLLRLRLMMTELGELADAIHTGDLEGVLDGLADLLYVTHGTAVAFGMIDVMDAAFREVHRSNLSKSHENIKSGEKYGPSGKGESYQPPNLKQFIEKYAQKI